MSFVKICKAKSSPPSDDDIRTAMSHCGGHVSAIDSEEGCKKVAFSGSVNHTVFENELIRVAFGKRKSWDFIWGDA